MTSFLLGTDLDRLAHELARQLELRARSADLFETATIVVPNRFLGKWLRFWLARHRDIAINLRFVMLEQFLWDLLKEIDPRVKDGAILEPEVLDEDSYRLLVLAVLLEQPRPSYWLPDVDGEPSSARQFCRRAWGLAGQLAALIRDYEYHRQDQLIQPWLQALFGKPSPVGGRILNEERTRPPTGLGSPGELEAAEREIFHQIVRLPDGKRELLCRATARNFKTLPQYAMEVRELFDSNPHAFRPPQARPLYLFAMTQMSELHLQTLGWLGRFFDLHFVQYNSLFGRLRGRPSRSSLQQLASLSDNLPGISLLRAWNAAGAESLKSFAKVADFRAGSVSDGGKKNRREMPSEQLTLHGPATSTVLARLQDQLLFGESETSPPRLPQDRSLQIVGCPGPVREVEVVYQSILHNLQTNPELKLTDIAVLATDMGLYRPLFQGVFDRDPDRLAYNLADFSAAGVSLYGQAVLGMLDLALESFARSKVFEVLLNPCFLGRLEIDADQARHWLDWTERLGVYQGWNAKDKVERGHPESPHFAWQLGLRRLRLGRIMDCDEPGGGPARRFGPVVPFADLESGDRGRLNDFCVAVDGLLPRLVELRNFQGDGPAWADHLQKLWQDFLLVPDEHPQEAHVREGLSRLLARLRLCDEIGVGAEHLQLCMIREIVQSQLEDIPGSKGQYLTGITVAALQPLRPLPFRLVYIVGLGERHFPGSNALSTYDLRKSKRYPGDIHPAEQRRFLFHEALLSARDKLTLTYDCYDVQKLETLHPSVPILQLREYLDEHIVERKFEIVKAPLQPHDPRHLASGLEAICEAFVQYEESERILAASLGENLGLISLTPEQKARLDANLPRHRPTFDLAATAPSHPRMPTITLYELRKFLENPARAKLERHLRVREEWEDDRDDDEPFAMGKYDAGRLARQTLEELVERAVTGDLAQALAGWRNQFARAHEDCRLRGQAPEGPFGDCDADTTLRELQRLIHGPGGMENFLRPRTAANFCGPIQIGESPTLLAARARYPHLTLKLTRPLANVPGGEFRLVGSTRLAWVSERCLEFLVLATAGYDGKGMARETIEPVLLYHALRALAADSRNLVELAPLARRASEVEAPTIVHVAHSNGIARLEYPAASPEESLSYLAELGTDFLDPTAFDLLPMREAFDVYRREDASEETFLEELRDKIDEAEQWGRASALLNTIGPEIPVDAWDKVQRRFGPLTPTS